MCDIDNAQAELEKKLDAATKENAQYQQQLEMAFAKIAAAQVKERSAAKVQLLKEKRELEHMRLRYLAAEEKKVMTAERKELDELKTELTRSAVLLYCEIVTEKTFSVIDMVVEKNTWLGQLQHYY